MTQKFKNGQRVRIIKGYSKPFGKIDKYSVILDTYDIQGDDGYYYRCIPSSEIIKVELKQGDKIRRKSDGKLFTFISLDDSGDENYGYVEEMCVPIYLPDFEKDQS